MKNNEGDKTEHGPASAARQGRNYSLPFAIAVMVLVVLAVVIVRIKALPVPLERDEGEYALMGQLILDGVPPFREAASMKLPGIYYAYSMILAVFGQTSTGIRLGLMVVNLFSCAFLFMIAMRLLGGMAAALTVAAFIAMSADLSVLGLFAHATQFVMMFALAGIWLLLESPGSRREAVLLWGAGLCLGLAVLMKQSGAFIALFAVLWVLFDGSRSVSWKRSFLNALTLACGIVVPYAVILVVMAGLGVFDRFWFWTVDYASSYVSLGRPEMGMALLEQSIVPIIGSNPLIWMLAPAGMIGIWFTETDRRTGRFLLAFFLFSFVAVCPGFYFRQHYFVQFLPAAALGAGAALRAIRHVVPKYSGHANAVGAALLLAVAASSLVSAFSTWSRLSGVTPGQFSRSVYGTNPFPESVEVAGYLACHTSPGERIAVLGSEPQIYFYAHRRPATEHIYMYGLMEPQPYALRMQEEMIAQVEKSAPQFVVLVLVKTSWFERRGSEKRLFEWMKGYLNSHYEPVLAADITSNGAVWFIDEEMKSFRIRRGSAQLVVHKRIPEAAASSAGGATCDKMTNHGAPACSTAYDAGRGGMDFLHDINIENLYFNSQILVHRLTPRLLSDRVF